MRVWSVTCLLLGSHLLIYSSQALARWVSYPGCTGQDPERSIHRSQVFSSQVIEIRNWNSSPWLGSRPLCYFLPPPQHLDIQVPGAVVNEDNGIGCTGLRVIFEYILWHPKCAVTQTLPCSIAVLLVSTYDSNPPSPLDRSLFRCCPSNLMPRRILCGVLLNDDLELAAGSEFPASSRR